MTKIFGSTALALVLSTALVHAQSSLTSPGSSDYRATHVTSGAGGTVGAMETYVYGIATSSEDVNRQQNGLNTGAEGGGLLRGRSTIRARYTAGTVGSTPGETQGR